MPIPPKKENFLNDVDEDFTKLFLVDHLVAVKRYISELFFIGFLSDQGH